MAGFFIFTFIQLSINPTEGASEVLIRVGLSRFLFIVLGRVEKVKVKGRALSLSVYCSSVGCDLDTRFTFGFWVSQYHLPQISP